MLATTYGTGQLIKNALDRGCKKIMIGLGGSATNDGGIGCAAVLGVKFYDVENKEVSLNGSGLSEIRQIDLSGLDKRLFDADIEVLCDVVSPLYGETGAAYVFAPQKGADENTVKLLDDGLKNLAAVTKETIGKDNSQVEGAGAAGGLGFGLISFLGAKLVKGAPAVLKATGFESAAKAAELVITGEGCMDNQSLLGKAPAEVAALSGDTPVVAIVGMSKVTDMSGSNIKRIYVTDHDERSFEQVLAECRADLAAAAHRVANDFYNGSI
jgi:glycerate kinase